MFVDFDSYVKAQEDLEKAYRDKKKWNEMAILNVARMGKFSTDRTMKEYNADIWNVEPTPIELD